MDASSKQILFLDIKNANLWNVPQYLIILSSLTPLALQVGYWGDYRSMQCVLWALCCPYCNSHGVEYADLRISTEGTILTIYSITVLWHNINSLDVVLTLIIHNVSTHALNHTASNTQMFQLNESWELYYNDVIISAMVSQNSPTSPLFAQLLAQAQIKENIKAPRHWHAERGIHRWPVNFPCKRPVAEKVFPFDNVIMMKDLAISVILFFCYWPIICSQSMYCATCVYDIARL